MTTLVERMFLGFLDFTRPIRGLFGLKFSQNNLFRRIVAGIPALDRMILTPTVVGEVMPHTVLEERHVKNCRVFENRSRILEQLPKDAVCCEVGILRGDFSAQILELTRPRKLHLIEFNESSVRGAERRFSERVAGGSVVLHLGDSARELAKFPDGYFDWMYIDANHSYEFVKRELEISRLKVKDGGLIILNDYIYFDHIYKTPYGVVQAVNGFCIEHGYEFVYFAFEPLMYCDVAVRKIPNS